MVENSSELAKSYPGASKRWKAKLPESQMSSFEKDFVTAIEMQEVHFVYQPVVNSSEKIVGFEILTRWHQSGRNVPPEEFFPELKSQSVLLLLTAMCFKHAIEGINIYRGKFFFSVNIHPIVAASPGLVNMCSEACRQLKDTRWKNQLVLEYSEKTDFSHSTDVLEIFKSISKQGLNIYLDDCFSDQSAFFPVRKYYFNGYKIDKYIINCFHTNSDDKALLLALSGYCSMTGKRCIAEGVEDHHVFDSLRRLGIEFFQGFYFFNPLRFEELSVLKLDEENQL